MRRIKRTKHLEVNLSIKDPTFINPPKEAQRNTLVNRALKEFVEDLEALHGQAKNFVPGDMQYQLSDDRTQGALTDEEIMEDWQLPIMETMADVVTEAHGDVLEIGFGRGVSADMIQARGVRSHTIIECNDYVVGKYQEWKTRYPDQDIRLVHGLWQDTINSLGQFDGIFFHTYPLNEEEYMKYVHGRVTFAEHFFGTAAAHLKEGGAFTYFSNEIDSLSRAHQRALFQHFSSFSLQVVPLKLPENIKDTWWADSMAIVKAVK